MKERNRVLYLVLIALIILEVSISRGWNGKWTSTKLWGTGNSLSTKKVDIGSSHIGNVRRDDVILVRPDNHGNILGAITAYTWRNKMDFPEENYELPIYKTLNILDDGFWNFLVDELLLSRVNVVMLHGRGCWNLKEGYDGTGSLCPRHLSKFVRAVELAGAEDVIRVGMWDDTGAYALAHQMVHGTNETTLDLGDPKNWELFWDHNMKIWFDTIPSNLWFRLEGKPVIAFWTLSETFFSNQEGNASRLLSWLKTQFKNHYDVEPHFIVQNQWFQFDSTMTEDHAFGRHCWIQPNHDNKTSIYSYTHFNNMTWGVVAPSFRNGRTRPGCGIACREVTRRNGETLNEALDTGRGANFTLLEGWTDMAESAGFYRSLKWKYPAQYINIIRRYADPEPETLRFQAEGADRFYDNTPGNRGDEYRQGDLDIQKLADNSGWTVAWTEPGEWLEYQEVELGCGTYRFTARVAAARSGNSIRLDLGDLPAVDVPNTGSFDDYQLVHLGQLDLVKGSYNLRIVFETGDVCLDWFFVKRSSRCSERAGISILQGTARSANDSFETILG